MSQVSERTRFEHPVFFYRDIGDFLAVMAPYVQEGIDAGELAFVAARGDLLDPLRSAVGLQAQEEARFVDTSRWHPHPSTRLRAFHELISEGSERGVPGFRLAGEPVWPLGPPELVCEWQRYEAALNAVLAEEPASLLCLYDASHLPAPILGSAEATHPTIRTTDGSRPSSRYESPGYFLQHCTVEPSEPPAWTRAITITNPAEVRDLVLGGGLDSGLDRDGVVDLCVAANEIATNALVYGSDVTLATWSELGSFVCQIEDRGPGISDPLAGYRPPDERLQSGRGLWMARQLVDLVQLASDDRGTRVRLSVHHDRALYLDRS